MEPTAAYAAVERIVQPVINAPEQPLEERASQALMETGLGQHVTRGG